MVATPTSMATADSRAAMVRPVRCSERSKASVAKGNKRPRPAFSLSASSAAVRANHGARQAKAQTQVKQAAKAMDGYPASAAMENTGVSTPSRQASTSSDGPLRRCDSARVAGMQGGDRVDGRRLPRRDAGRRGWRRRARRPRRCLRRWCRMAVMPPGPAGSATTASGQPRQSGRRTRHAPAARPSRMPGMAKISASARKCRRICPRVAPMARRMPISFRRRIAEAEIVL